MAREYHKVYSGKKHCGFVAPTVDMPGVWSIYNQERKKVAMVAPDGGQFNLMFYGKHAATTDYYTAESFPGAVQRAFKLEESPQFLPKLPEEALDPMGVALREMGAGMAANSPPTLSPKPSPKPSPPAATGGTGPGGVDGIDAYLEGLLAEHGEARSKLYVLDLVISKARALRSKLM